jgi:hypothetical protein
MKIWMVTAALLILGGSPRSADACSCSGPRAVVWPNAGPTNAHLFVWIPEPKLTVYTSPLAVRVQGSKTRLDVDETSTMSGEMRVVEVAPRTLLTSRTTYEVVDAKDAVIDTFTTGDGPRTDKVEWKGLSKAEHGKYKNAGGGSCRMGAPFVRLGVVDPPKDAVYAIWIGKDGAVDYTKSPTTFATVRGNNWLIFGRASVCSIDNFPVPKKGRLTFGVKLVGDAGVKSTPGEITIDMSKPVELDGY